MRGRPNVELSVTLPQAEVICLVILVFLVIVRL